jgi:predicted site-specific integrase-resolvase
MPDATTTADTWISLAKARRALGVAPPTLRRLIADGRISSLEVPGGRPKVLRADVVRVLSQSTTVATDQD